jgi:para-aminobenzoate synthetase component I
LNSKSYNIDDVVVIKRKMLNWVNRFNIFSFLDSCSYNTEPHRYDLAVGAGTKSVYVTPLQVDTAIAARRWLFGHVCYEFNHALHKLDVKPDAVGFPLFYFFEPEVVVTLSGYKLEVIAADPDEVYQAILEQLVEMETVLPVQLKQRLDKQQYLDVIINLQRHIHRGDCYEINFCQEFYADNAALNVVGAFQLLQEISPNPFTALYRVNDSFLLCASPERFLFREGNRILSQPIKGTIRRELSDPVADQQLRDELANSAKDRSENVMVVDLVRNDLSMVCDVDSVVVEELYGIYSFPQVHQMISTISGRCSANFAAVINALFPMGSMTGAPRHRVMELISQYETQARGIFSGTVGYIRPGGNFDFNVVIRSVMYNRVNQYLSCQVGSGITIYSDPEKEWEECLLKAAAIKKVLGFDPALFEKID